MGAARWTARGSSPHISGVFREWPTISSYRLDCRFGDGSSVPRRVRIQLTAIGSVGGIAVLHRPNSRLRAVVHADLPQNRLHVDLDRRLRDVARARNHLVGMPFHETVEDLDLALRQTVVISDRGHVHRMLRQGADADGYIFMFGAVRPELVDPDLRLI